MWYLLRLQNGPLDWLYPPGHVRLKQFVRYAVAIVVGLVTSEALGILLAPGIGALAGQDVTGGRWALNEANVVLTVCKGLPAAFTAGHIARRRGILIGALTAFLPLVAVLLLSLAMNRDILGAIEEQSYS